MQNARGMHAGRRRLNLQLGRDLDVQYRSDEPVALDDLEEENAGPATLNAALESRPGDDERLG